jgi:hypothetical protein
VYGKFLTFIEEEKEDGIGGVEMKFRHAST